MNTKYLRFAAFLLSSVLLLSFSGCTPAEVDGARDNAPISFSTYTGTQLHTRSVETKPDNMKTDGFGIMAYITEGNYGVADVPRWLYMDNQKVVYDDASSTPGWTYAPAKFWPGGSYKVSFFAYAPYDANNSKGIKVTDESGTPKITFTASTPKTTPDLVIANETSEQIDRTEGKVTFHFKHSLARVRMLAKTSVEVDPATTKVRVTNVELLHSNKLASVAALDMVTGEWTPTAYLSGTYNLGATSSEINHTATTNLFGENQDLFFIPVATAAEDVKLRITYQLVTLSGGTEGYTSTVSQTIPLGADSFERNKSYTYTFAIGLDGITMDTDIDVFIPIEEEIKEDETVMKIATAADLVRFRDRVNGTGDYADIGAKPALNGVQVADIDMNEAAENSTGWIPIKDYEGTYNGNGRKIKNLKLIGNKLPDVEANIALFANTKSGSLLTGICIEDGILNNATNKKHYGALLAGIVEGTVSYCSVTGNITMVGLSESVRKAITGSYWAGLIYQVSSTGTVTYCKTKVNTSGGDGYVRTGGGAYMSGFVCINKGLIAFSFSDISGGASYIQLLHSGFVINNSGQIYGCRTRGSMSNQNYYVYMGGFIHTAAGGTIASCYSQMTLSINGISGSNAGAGGFIYQYSSGDVANCFSNTIFACGAGNNYCGGFTRSSNATPSIKNCFSISTRTGNCSFAHFSLNNITKVENCYTTGTPASGGANEGITIDESLTAPPAGTRPIDWIPTSPVTIKTTKADPVTRYYSTTVEEITISSGADLWEEELNADGYPRIKGLE